MSKRLKPFSYEEFKELYSKVPRLTVEVVVKTKGGIILIKRTEKSWNGTWHIPGGTVFYGETLKAAVKRVAKEEIGINVKTFKLIGYIEYPSEEKERGFGWSVGIVFLCELNDESTIELDKKEDIKIFKNLPDNFIQEQKDIIKTVLQNKQSSV